MVEVVVFIFDYRRKGGMGLAASARYGNLGGAVWWVKFGWKLKGAKGASFGLLSGVESIMQRNRGKVNSHIRGEIFAYTKTCMKRRKRA
ncbi:MAG: hypothetical protein C0469_01865 [Cyanobacteria bacterium DS2.3.42]|nr:hypothetical protein [Cyanobacteria bacterium DS2.3.42]